MLVIRGVILLHLLVGLLSQASANQVEANPNQIRESVQKGHIGAHVREEVKLTPMPL